MLQGGHDADMTAMRGIKQYNRVDFESNPDAFKAVAYINRANHGQFNTAWGRHDKGSAVYTPILNLKPLLSGEEQRTAANVFVTSFLEATRHGREEYREMFQRPAGARAWLPEDVYVTQYRDPSFKAVSTYETAAEAERIDTLAGGATQAGGTTLTDRATQAGEAVPVGSASLTGFASASCADLPLRDGEKQGNKALLLRWDEGAAPEYAIRLPGAEDAGWALWGDESLTFALAQAADMPAEFGMWVELVDGEGNVASVSFDRFGALPPPLQAVQVKSETIASLVKQGYDFESRFERVGQVYAIPLAAFRSAAPEFDPARVFEVRFKFEGAKGGGVYLDDVGFRD